MPIHVTWTTLSWLGAPERPAISATSRIVASPVAPPGSAPAGSRRIPLSRVAAWRTVTRLQARVDGRADWQRSARAERVE